MDFLTSLPYWGILVLVLINAILVMRMNIEIDESEEE